MITFKNKVAIITGGASGIGKASAEKICALGGSVVIADINKEHGDQTIQEFTKKGYKSAFFQIDVTSEKENEALIAFTLKQFGQLDIVFANAGIADDQDAAHLSFEKWKKTIAINLDGVFLLNKKAIEYWTEHHKPGVIVNCGSIHSWVGKSHVTAYAASKGGVKLLTQTLAIDYGQKNIRVNAVCPGYIDTPLLNQPGMDKAKLAALHPLGRLGTAEEVANVVAFLASDAASFVTGAAYLVDGGYTAQ